jgi:taurine transport system substrate-binding protein
MKRRSMLKGAVAGLALLSGAQAAYAMDEVTVAYFMEWPMPFQYAKAMGTFDQEMGVKVNWVAFDTGTAMSAAMAAGDVHFAVSQGVPPFVVATSAGQDLQIIDVAVSYSDNDNCVCSAAGDRQDNAAELAGKKVAVPLGTAAHYGFLRQMDHFGIDLASLEIVDMAPPDGAAALRRARSTCSAAMGRFAAPRQRAWQCPADRGRKGRTGHPGVRRDLGARALRGREPRAGGQVPEGDGRCQRHVERRRSKQAEMLPVIAKDAGMDEVATAKRVTWRPSSSPRSKTSCRPNGWAAARRSS